MTIFGQRILILVPHPDDEIVGCAAAIGRAQARGASLFALYLTHGCIARETLWPWQRKNYEKYVELRRAEAEKTSDFMGLTPIGWSSRPARHLWHDLAGVYREMEAAIAAHAIDQLWVPAYEGGNADHDALNALAARWKSERLAGSTAVLEFAEYNFAGGKTHSQEFPTLNGNEQRIILTPEERIKKRAALDLYKSERRNLNYIEIDHECYRPLASYDYSLPPHPGILWYARFQWVPFRHPRVDFSRPEEISRALARFLGNTAT